MCRLGCLLRVHSRRGRPVAASSILSAAKAARSWAALQSRDYKVDRRLVANGDDSSSSSGGGLAGIG